ncbi:photosynthetic complex assembly protein PuhC [Sphingomonas sp. S1-29]|uniref:photosynthetic complex assembly protein PuhC n=1 Tax=Sphingomonas sp. S1-29 TaxID=2991074 RepID=UPI00223F87BD|nr:photosynthetic complex assembly protein PuhC [Sphingomonas sp. S1-29]UZK69550.1 photosynthetic complex assembly protein PuhC [Sphingomonas sp. S1-29]
MSAHSHENTVPRGALMMVAVLVGLALAMTAAFRLAQMPPTASPVLERAAAGVAAIDSRSLRFFDQADGGVLIERIGETPAVIEPGQQTGFVRGVMRGMARDRRMRGIGNEPPFTLTAWADGGLSLSDPSTGRIVELNGFGNDNRAAFAALLQRGPAK